MNYMGNNDEDMVVLKLAAKQRKLGNHPHYKWKKYLEHRISVGEQV